MGLRDVLRLRREIHGRDVTSSLEKASLVGELTPSLPNERLWQQGNQRRAWNTICASLGKITTEEQVTPRTVQIIKPAVIIELSEQASTAEVDLATTEEVAS